MANKLTFSVGLLFYLLLPISDTFYIPPDVDTEAAIQLAMAMDPEADPCQDFFQYACGNWNRNNPIPKSKSTWSQFDNLNEQLFNVLKEILEDTNAITDPLPLKMSRQMYIACMDTETLEAHGLTSLTDYLGLFGGWPMTLDNWRESSFDWQEATVSATTIYNLNFLISIFNEQDGKNTEVDAIFVDQGSLILPRSVLMDFEDNSKVTEAYRALMMGSALAIRDWLRSNVTNAQIEVEVEAVLKFESQLALITVPEESRRNNSRTYNPMSLSELQRWTDTVVTTSSQAKINWLDYLSDIFATANITIFDDERVIVMETKYLRALVKLLDDTPPRVLANYIHWRLVDALAPNTNQQMQDLQFSFSKVYEGVSQPISRSGKCIDAVNDLMGYALGSVYVKKMFDDQAESEVKVMVTNLKRAFKSLVNDATWMDSTTKSIAMEKADAIVEFVGYPPWIKNNTALEDYYDGLSVVTSNHFENMQMVNAYRNQLQLSTLRTKNNRSGWTDAPTIVNAFYAEKTNSITFPAAILQPPYFVKGRSAALNYGSMGSMIGHEITHGFDDQGRQGDKNGNTVQWWTGKTLVNYQEHVKCFIDQYSNYTVLNGMRLNGVNTQGENLADNGGLREAFRAYRYYVAEHGVESTKMENFTPEQMFFLSYANSYCGANTPEELAHLVESDPHSPFRYRVIGTLSNNEDFVREFKCRPGTPMNRLNKCVLW